MHLIIMPLFVDASYQYPWHYTRKEAGLSTSRHVEYISRLGVLDTGDYGIFGQVTVILVLVVKWLCGCGVLPYIQGAGVMKRQG